ncbi:MAG: electron transfer flavoprotein subunit beta/FixA family protein [Bacillota bacterium]|nr:electron transfer flavoprotein subunit beta/FixA family protein [Bacillota bacterium]
MRILVLVKPVPDPEKYNELQIDRETKRLMREGVPTVIDPASKSALEAALVLRDERNAAGEESSITVLSMAPDFSRDKLVECLAMGADKACLLSDRAFGGADTYATSFVLAAVVKKLSADEGQDFDLILAGNESADGATAQVPVQLAEWLGISHISRVCGIAAEGKRLRVIKKSEDELLTFEGEGQIVLAVTRDINRPRLINAMGIVKARKKPLTIWTNEELKLDEDAVGLKGSPTQPGRLITPDLSRSGQPLTAGADAGAEDAAKAILSLLKKEGF